MSSIPHVRDFFASEFEDHHRMLAVRFGGREPDLLPPERSFLAYRLEFTERFSEPFRAVVYGITPGIWRLPHAQIPGDRDIEPHPDRFLGLLTDIEIRAEGRVRDIHGVVTAARNLGTWYKETEGVGYDVFELVIDAPLRLLDLRRANRVYQERTASQILHELLNEHRHRNTVADDTLVAAFPNDRGLAEDVRAWRMQYQESDLDFIQRLLIDEGLSWVLVADKDERGFANTWHVFPPHHDFGTQLDAILSCTPGRDELPLLDWQGSRKLVPAYTTTRSHEYKDNRTYEARATGRQNVGMGERARGDFGNYETLSPRAVPGNERGLIWPARRRQWAYDMEAEVFEGETTAPLNLAKPIRVLGLDGGTLPFRPPGVELDEHANDYIVTAQTLVALAPLPGSMRERWHTLNDHVRRRAGVDMFPPEGTEAVPLRVMFEAHPCGKPLVPPHPRAARRPTPGPTTATVVGNNGDVVTTDALGRIAVRFHWEREPDVILFQSNYPDFSQHTPIRVRYVHPGAGRGVGMQYLPRVGDEVLVLFIDNDLDRPIAVGSVHNGSLGTPAFGGVSELPKDSALTGLRTAEHKGGGANELVFDDTQGEVGLRLGSTTAATHLSLGHVATPRQGGKAAARGTGAELRTDGAAALRAAQGLLLSAHGTPAGARHLEHVELAALLDSCKALLHSIETNIRRSPELRDGPEGRNAISDSLATWNTAGSKAPPRPILAMTSPDGIVSATPASMLAFAEQNVDLVSGKQMQLHSGGQAHVAAASGIAVHTADGGIVVRAEAGAVEVRSQNDELSVSAETNLLITARRGKVQIFAPVIELISSNGSYLRISDDIEMGSPGDLSVKTPAVHLLDEAKLNVPTQADDPTEVSDTTEHPYLNRSHSERRRRSHWKEANI